MERSASWAFVISRVYIRNFQISLVNRLPERLNEFFLVRANMVVHPMLSDYFPGMAGDSPPALGALNDLLDIEIPVFFLHLSLNGLEHPPSMLAWGTLTVVPMTVGCPWLG